MLSGEYIIRDFQKILSLSKEEIMNLFDILDRLHWLRETIGYKDDKISTKNYKFLNDLQDAQKFSLAIASKRRLINNSKCFKEYGQTIKKMVDQGILYRLFSADEDKMNSLIKYIQENIDSLQLMRDNVDLLLQLISPWSEIVVEDKELELSTVLTKKDTDVSKVQKGIVSDGTKIYSSNGKMNQYPVTVKNASIIIEVDSGPFRFWDETNVKITLNSLLFDGKKLGTKEEIIKKALNPDIPEEYYDNINTRLDKLEAESKAIEEYKNALNGVKQYLTIESKNFASAEKLAEELEQQFEDNMQQAVEDTSFSKDEYQEALERRLKKGTYTDYSCFSSH